MVDLRVGFLFLLVSVSVDARPQLPPRNPQGFEYHKLANQVYPKDFGSDDLCVLCEEYAKIVIEYLTANTTETEVIEILQIICSLLGSFEEECTALVDYLTPILFSELSSIDADTFCQDVGLCKEEAIVTSLTTKKNRCELCEDAVSDVFTKLRNSNTRADVVRALLRACDSVENHANKCKKMVFEYAPLIVSSTVQFPEPHDVCVAVHACAAPFALAKPAHNVGLPLSSDF